MSKAQHPSFSGTVHLAADHAGYELKEFIQDKLSEIGYKVEDDGAHERDAHDDYPDMIRPAAEAVAEDKHSRAIIFGKSGQGEAMMANRIMRVRAAVYTGGDMEVVKLARVHNDANVLSIGADFVAPEVAWEAVQLFLKTVFSGEDRHVRRIHELDA
jgi:ribose 5-phosphate isomerase B